MVYPQVPVLQFLLSGFVTLALIGLFQIATEVLRRVKSPLGDLPGPNSSHWFYGNSKEIRKLNYSVIGEWIEKYGTTFKFYQVSNNKTLCTVDSRAINHVMNHNYEYQKPVQQRNNLANILGEGVLFAEGDPHKNQRKIMNPAFGPMQIRALTEVFNEKSIQLRDAWMGIIAEEKSARINAIIWLSKATLDIIGQAGFNYEFNALNVKAEDNELSKAFATRYRAGTRRGGVFDLIRQWIPLLQVIPTAHQRRINASQAAMSRIGNVLLADAKAAVYSSDQSNVQSRDLLSLLVRANTATDLPESQRMSDKDVLAQVPTFLVAGHETTSAATSWALFCLTQAPGVQRKLREELLQISTDSPTMDELNDLPYLEHVVRESLRLYSPVTAGMREAMKDDVIPLDTPIIDRHGKTQHSIKINKGDSVYIPIIMVNRSKATWGEDALEFKPERWDSIPDAAHHVPGLWGNQLTFSTGPRACIGYRFSLVEMKALLFALVRAFEFELAVPGKDIAATSTTIVQRPFVLSEPTNSGQLPLIIKPYMS